MLGAFQPDVRGIECKILGKLVAIELDEPSHAKPERQTRDVSVDAAIEAAGLPFVRVLTSRSYETRELAAAILPHLGSERRASQRP